jgi:hypothetical protein
MDRSTFLKVLARLDNPDQAAAAARHLAVLMKQNNLTWDKVVSNNAFLSFTPSAARPPGEDHREVCAKLLELRRAGIIRLGEKEAEFLVSCAGRTSLTEKQEAWYSDICAKWPHVL